MKESHRHVKLIRRNWKEARCEIERKTSFEFCNILTLEMAKHLIINDTTSRESLYVLHNFEKKGVVENAKIIEKTFS